MELEFKNKIIYTKKKALALIKMGFIPVATLPNPKDSSYQCWVFERVEGFDKAYGEICVAHKMEAEANER